MRTSRTFDVTYVLRQYVNTSDSSDVIFSSLIKLVMVSFSVIITLCHVDISNVSWKITEELLKRWKSGLFYLAGTYFRELLIFEYFGMINFL